MLIKFVHEKKLDKSIALFRVMLDRKKGEWIYSSEFQGTATMRKSEWDETNITKLRWTLKECQWVKNFVERAGSCMKCHRGV